MTKQPAKTAAKGIIQASRLKPSLVGADRTFSPYFARKKPIIRSASHSLSDHRLDLRARWYRKFALWMIAIRDRQPTAALAGQTLADFLERRLAGRCESNHGSGGEQNRDRAGRDQKGHAVLSGQAQSPPGRMAGSGWMAGARTAAAIAARSRRLGHMTITVPNAMMKPPAHSQKTSGVRKT